MLTVLSYRANWIETCPKGCHIEGSGDSSLTIEILEDYRVAEYIATRINEAPCAYYCHLIFQRGYDPVYWCLGGEMPTNKAELSVQVVIPESAFMPDSDEQEYSEWAETQLALENRIRAEVAALLEALAAARQKAEEDAAAVKAAEYKLQLERQERARYEELRLKFEAQSKSSKESEPYFG